MREIFNLFTNRCGALSLALWLTWLTMNNLRWMKGNCSTNVTPWQSIWRCESSSKSKLERKFPFALTLAASGFRLGTHAQAICENNNKEASDREMIECKRHECMTYSPNERWKLRNAIMRSKTQNKCKRKQNDLYFIQWFDDDDDDNGGDNNNDNRRLWLFA